QQHERSDNRADESQHQRKPVECSLLRYLQVPAPIRTDRRGYQRHDREKQASPNIIEQMNMRIVKCKEMPGDELGFVAAWQSGVNKQSERECQHRGSNRIKHPEFFGEPANHEAANQKRADRRSEGHRYRCIRYYIRLTASIAEGDGGKDQRDDDLKSERETEPYKNPFDAVLHDKPPGVR